MALIFYLSSLPGAQAARVFDNHLVIWIGSLRSILAHLVLFGIMASFIQATIWSWTAFTNHSLRFALVAIILTAGYGLSDEIHQSFIAGRTMSALDLLVNTLGAMAAVATLHVLTEAAFNSPISPFKITRSKA